MVYFDVDKTVASKLPCNLLRAVDELKQLMDELEKEISNMPMITFDPKHTKPVNITSLDIMGSALAEEITVKIKLYSHRLLSKQPLAVVMEDEPNAIYFNLRTLGKKRPVAEWREIIGQKLTVIFDNYSPYSFRRSAPEKMGRLLSNLYFSAGEA